MANFGGSYGNVAAFGNDKGASSSRNNLPEHNRGEHGSGYFTNLLLHKSPPRASPRPRRDGPSSHYQRVFNFDPRRDPNHTIDLRTPQERCVLNQQCLTLSFPGPPSHPVRLMVDTNSADGSVDINVVMTNDPPSVRPVSPTTAPNNVQASRRGLININAPLSRTALFEFGGRSIDATPVELVPAPQWTPTPGTMVASFQPMQHNPFAAGPSNYQEINHAPRCIVGPRTLHPGESLQLRRNEATNQWNEELIGHQANDFDECYCKCCWNGPLPPHVAEYGYTDDEPQEEANNFNMGANAEEAADDMDPEEAVDDMNVDDGAESDEDYRFVEEIRFLIGRTSENLDHHHMNQNGEGPLVMEEEDDMDEPEFNGLPIELIPQALRREQFSPFIAALTSRTDRSCIICFEEFRAMQDNGILKCEHEFHYDCIETWLKNNNSCPLCRAVALEDGDYLTLANN